MSLFTACPRRLRWQQSHARPNIWRADEFDASVLQRLLKLDEGTRTPRWDTILLFEPQNRSNANPRFVSQILRRPPQKRSAGSKLPTGYHTISY